MASGRTDADEDPIETQDWIEAINSVLETEGPERAQFLLQRLSDQAKETGAPAALRYYHALQKYTAR